MKNMSPEIIFEYMVAIAFGLVVGGFIIGIGWMFIREFFN